MHWWKRFSLRTSSRTTATVIAIEAALLLPVLPASAQQTVEQRYQQALEHFNNARMEDACELFQQIEKESLGYKESITYLKASCAQTKRLYSMEEKLFNEGEELFKKGNYDDAKQKFDQAERIPLKNPKYRAQIVAYLKDIEARQGEESLFDEAVELFNRGKDTEASARFNRLIQSSAARSAEARTYLQRIDGRREERAFDAAVAAFNGGRYDDARRGFDQFANGGGPRAAEARDYLQRIDTNLKREASLREAVLKAQAGAKDPLQLARQFFADAQGAAGHKEYGVAVEKLRVGVALDPANRNIRRLLAQVEEQAAEQNLRTGLEAYFEARYEEAERTFTDYLIKRGRRQALAYFFRGAVHSTLYFLSDEQDVAQKQKAVGDFRALEKESPRFRPPEEVISPKILALYGESVKGDNAQRARDNK